MLLRTTLACTLCLIGCLTARAADPRPKMAPKVDRYLHESDEFVVRTSAETVVPKEKKAGRFYSGSSLTRFRYVGPPGTGGIYDALRDYYRQQNLDPKKYEYP